MTFKEFINKVPTTFRMGGPEHMSPFKSVNPSRPHSMAYRHGKQNKPFIINKKH